MYRRLAFSSLIALLLLAATAAGAGAGGGGGGQNDSPFFRTPSGNIGCFAGSAATRCDIRKRDWTPPPAPADCMFDYGYGVAVTDKGPGDYICASDSALEPGAKVLRNGEKIKDGGFKCKNREGGIKCVNKKNGHGFEISRQAVDLF